MKKSRTPKTIDKANVTLTYFLPEDKNEFEMAYHGIDYYCALSDIMDRMRALRKYKESKDHPTMETLEQEFWTILNARGIEI